MKKAKAPQEDPTIKAARDREQARADAAFISNTQELLTDETKRRNRRFGRRTAMTGVSPASGPGTVGGAAVSGGAGGGGFTLGDYGPLA